MNTATIYNYFTRPMTWVTACFSMIFLWALIGYRDGEISPAFTILIATASVIGYAAAHFAQHRIGRSLKLTQDAANRS